MPGPDPDFPDRWTNFFDMIDNIRVFTSTTSNSVIRFEVIQTPNMGFFCEATNQRWYCLTVDIANTLQGDLDPDRAQLVTSWLEVSGAPDLMSYINYYG
jgi:hypothetical protein